MTSGVLNLGTGPVPLAGSPMAGLLFVHVYVVPGIELIQLVALELSPVHTVSLMCPVIIGEGVTEILTKLEVSLTGAAHVLET